jgi:hypothetical protein
MTRRILHTIGSVAWVFVAALAGCAREIANDNPFADPDYGSDPDGASSATRARATSGAEGPMTPSVSALTGQDATAFDGTVGDADLDAAGKASGFDLIADAGSALLDRTGNVAADDAAPSHPSDAAESPWEATMSEASDEVGSEGGVNASSLVDAAPPPSVSTASPGDLLVTEIMFAPWGPEPQSEWFEVYNSTDEPKLLSGLTIEDGYPRTHRVLASPPVIAPAQSYVVFVRDRAVALANVVPEAAIVYEYGTGLSPGDGIQLENDASGALSLWNGSTELANVPYGPWDLTSYGQSLELDALIYAGSDNGASWCLGEHAWAAGSDDGTPGAANDCP